MLVIVSCLIRYDTMLAGVQNVMMRSSVVARSNQRLSTTLSRDRLGDFFCLCLCVRRPETLRCGKSMCVARSVLINLLLCHPCVKIIYVSWSCNPQQCVKRMTSIVYGWFAYDVWPILRGALYKLIIIMCERNESNEEWWIWIEPLVQYNLQ